MTEEKKPTPVAPEKKETSSAPEAHGKPHEKTDRSRRGGGRSRRDKGEREAKEFEESILKIDRVTRVVKGGRRLRFRISVIIGDQKGRVGFGIGKATEVMVGIQKAVSKAKRALIHVPLVKGTIPHAVNEKFKASHVLLFPAPEGKGLIAGGAVRKIMELAGAKNILSKIHGSRNKLNVAYATFNALKRLQRVEVKKEETSAPAAEAKVAPAKEAAPKKEKTEPRKKAPQSKK